MKHGMVLIHSPFRANMRTKNHGLSHPISVYKTQCPLPWIHESHDAILITHLTFSTRWLPAHVQARLARWFIFTFFLCITYFSFKLNCYRVHSSLFAQFYHLCCCVCLIRSIRDSRFCAANYFSLLNLCPISFRIHRCRLGGMGIRNNDAMHIAQKNK